jgi:pyridinium-3,5-bisthiocarboxylic acid mononucleotide nickel chelatase
LKIAYFDCSSGISGDMCLGALVDAGVSVLELQKSLRAIPVKGYSLVAEKVKRNGIAATKVDVVLKKGRSGPETEIRTWKDISAIIDASSLPETIRRKGDEIFRSIFEAEAHVHGVPFAKVHLHELSSVDCIVDIFGTLICLSLLGIDEVYSSPVNLGSGFVQTAHGALPVPAPATAILLKHSPVYSSEIPFELTTPTGAAILKSVTKSFGTMPCMRLENNGNGAGDRHLDEQPNLLRLFIGEMQEKTAAGTVTVIETNIDDMNPQIYDYVFEELFRLGALDVYMTQVIMKKTRPGVKLSVICEHHRRNDLIHIILKETTSIGVRFFEAERMTMEREISRFASRYGEVGVKTSKAGKALSKTSPEYEDCRKIALRTAMPLREIIEEISSASRKEGKKQGRSHRK